MCTEHVSHDIHVRNRGSPFQGHKGKGVLAMAKWQNVAISCCIYDQIEVKVLTRFYIPAPHTYEICTLFDSNGTKSLEK